MDVPERLGQLPVLAKRRSESVESGRNRPIADSRQRSGLHLSRLSQFGQTVAPVELAEPLQELERLQYIEVETITSNGITVSLLGQPALLTNYFWSIWVPKHLLACGLKVAITPHLDSAQGDAHHCTVVFRIPGSREATREFLTDLATQYPGNSPEIVAIQAGNVLSAGGGQ